MVATRSTPGVRPDGSDDGARTVGLTMIRRLVTVTVRTINVRPPTSYRQWRETVRGGRALGAALVGDDTTGQTRQAVLAAVTANTITRAFKEDCYQAVVVRCVHSFWRALIICAIIVPVWFVVHAAELDGVQLPDTLQMDRKLLHLNGFGLRTFSVLGIHIYVASLYLEHLSTDPEAIIQSPDTKLLIVRFERSVSADDARKAWRDGLEHNCVAPCRLDPADVERFLAMVPAMHEGDNYSMLFAQHRAVVTVSGHQIGTISQPHFADAMLATFLGPNPASPRLKRALLQGHG